MFTYNYNKEKKIITITIIITKKDFIKLSKNLINYSLFLFIIKIIERTVFNTEFFSNIFPDITYQTFLNNLFTLYSEIVALLPLDFLKLINSDDLPKKEIKMFTEKDLENKKIIDLQDDLLIKKLQRFVIISGLLVGFIATYLLRD